MQLPIVYNGIKYGWGLARRSLVEHQRGHEECQIPSLLL